MWGLLGTGELFFVVFFAFLRLLAIFCEHEAFRFFFLWTFAKNIFSIYVFFLGASSTINVLGGEHSLCPFRMVVFFLFNFQFSSLLFVAFGFAASFLLPCG